MKLGASDSMAGGVTWGPAMILHPWVILGIIAYIAGLAVWLIALPRMALHLAYGLSAVVHLLVPLASWLFLMELIPLGRFAGMILILIGSIVLASIHEGKKS